MSSLEQIDLQLGEALEYLMRAASNFRSIETIDSVVQLRRIGKATVELWSIREDIYQFNPEIRPDHVKEINEDEIRYEELQIIHLKAVSAESAGYLDEAKKYFDHLYNASKYGHFKRLAEAGLYRVTGRR